MPAHLFADEINTESDLVGENLATERDELYFQDLPIYNKLNISSAKVGGGGGGGGNRHPLRQERETHQELIRRQAEGEVVENAENWFKPAM